MYLLGTTLTKLLAVVAALMTVAAGVPRTECHCPDGRVKLFCHGTSSNPSGCCCATACSSSPDARASCCEAGKATARGTKAAKKRPCCAQAHAEPPKGPGTDGGRLLGKTACCTKTVVPAPAADTAVTTGILVHQAVDVLDLGTIPLVVPHVVANAAVARPPPGSLTPPPDLVVVLCHFTC
jgi:hypothetical protein